MRELFLLSDNQGQRHRGAGGHTVKISVVILTTMPCLILYFFIFFTRMSSELLDDNVVTHIMCIANLNLLGVSVVTYDERVVN